MQNIVVELSTEQEKVVLLAFLNALNYNFKLENSEHYNDVKTGHTDILIGDDNKPESLSHYATE